MSFRVVAKVLAESEETLARRLILIVLAEAASDDGVAWIDQETIAAKARLSRTHVTERLREMHDDGSIEIRKASRGRRRINVYRVVLPGLVDVDYDRLPFALDLPFAIEMTTSEDPTRSEVDDVGSTGSTTSDLPSISESRPLIGPVRGPVKSSATESRLRTVDRVAVTEDEIELASGILSEWNRQTRQTLNSDEWRRKIVLRIREHPELDLDAHAFVIARTLAAPWWRGPASPSVLYGNGAIFERSVVAAQSQEAFPRDGSATSSALDLARELRERGQ